MDQTYELFDLRIFRSQEGIYPVEVLRSPAGEAAGEFKLPFAQNEIAKLMERLESGEADRQALQEIGQQLYRMLFVPPIERRYRESLAALKSGVGLRVRLRVDPPELTILPWEFLCDPQEGEYINLSPHAPLVRYVPAETAVEPLETEAPVRLLLVASNPADAPPLDTAKETALVQEALAEKVAEGLFVVDVLEHPTLSRLADSLREAPYAIVHFLGHAFLNPDDGQGYLVLENEAGQSAPVDADTLTQFFKDTSVRLLVLNACESGRSGGRDAQLGLAPSLVKNGVPAVVAMQFPVPDRTAVLLSREFYSALADNAPVDAAISEARKIIRAEVGADSFDWGIPVLFMRAPEGMLLHVTPPPRPKGELVFSRRGWAAIIAGGLLLLAVLGAIAFGVLRQAGVIPTPEPTLVAAPAAEGEFLILAADFYPKSPNQAFEVVGRMATPLKQALIENQITNARVVGVPDQPRTREEAIKLASRYQASIVVWGWYDNLDLEANIEVLDSPFLAGVGGATLVGGQASQAMEKVPVTPESLRAYLNEGLSSQVSYLVLYTVGRVYYWQGINAEKALAYTEAEAQFQQAIQVLDRALTAAGETPEGSVARLSTEVVYYSIGTSYLKLRDIRSPAADLGLASASFESAIALQPNFADAYYNLGRVYRAQKRDDEAIQQFLLAAEKDDYPDHWIAKRAYVSIGFVYAQNKRDPQQAEPYFQKAAELAPNDVTVLANLAFMEYVLGKYDQAIQIIQQAIEVNPDEALDDELFVTCNLGLFYLAKGDTAQGTSAYASVISRIPQLPAAAASDTLESCISDLSDLSSEKPGLESAITPILNDLNISYQTVAPTPAP